MKQNNAIWLGVGGLLVLAAAVYTIRKNKNSGTQKPPKRAPQLHIENPGTQNEFPVSPMESEIG